jgi:hypothetical protein
MSTVALFNVQQPYLVTEREFPQDLKLLQPVLVKAWNDLSYAMNARVIGLYDRVQVVTGERWFNDSTAISQGNVATASLRRQSYRQVYTFGAINAGASLTINHNISNVVNFTHIYGTCITSVPDFRPIPYSSATLVTNQIEIKVTSTQINIINGNTAPNIVSGIVVLEYLLV